MGKDSGYYFFFEFLKLVWVEGAVGGMRKIIFIYVFFY